jgi:hypothetical protein
MNLRRRISGSMGLAALAMLLASLASTPAIAGVRLGFDVLAPPLLVPIPASPVQYAPSIGGNYFFYAGRYYAFTDDVWYASSGYDGPWLALAPELVPVPLLAVPISYYRLPPRYWAPWRRDRPPRWEETRIRHPDERRGPERSDVHREHRGHRG